DLRRAGELAEVGDEARTVLAGGRAAALRVATREQRRAELGDVRRQVAEVALTVAPGADQADGDRGHASARNRAHDTLARPRTRPGGRHDRGLLLRLLEPLDVPRLRARRGDLPAPGRGRRLEADPG